MKKSVLILLALLALPTESQAGIFRCRRAAKCARRRVRLASKAPFLRCSVGLHRQLPGSGPGGSGDCRRWLPEELDVSSGVPNHEPARATPGDSINRSRSLRLRLVAQWRPGSIRAWRGVLRREPFSMGRRERPESESLWHGASRHAGSSAERGSRTVSFGHLPNVACLAWTSRSIA